MEGRGIENPVFEPPSPDAGRERQASSAKVDGGNPALSGEGPCGWGCFAPRALQVCNNPEGFLAMYSLLAIFQGMVVNGLINISISTIEKRYELNSSLTGLISASYDISFCILALFVSFFGERGHKPRWLAFSAFMLGLGSLIFSLPHFSSGKYHFGTKLEDTCQIPGTRSANFTCSASAMSSLSNYLYVFILGQLMLGVGGTPLYTLGTAFIDDSVAKHKSSLYIGIGYAMSLLGPAVGYVLGGQLLAIYIDIEIPESTKMDPDDPRWLGAWWIGFLVCFVAIWPLIIPFSCFPKYLPGTAKIQSEKISETHDDGSELLVETQNIGKSFKDFPVALLILVKNPVLMSLIAASTSEALVATGFATFLPKLIENQFGKTSSFSATLAGCASLVINKMKKMYHNCSCIGKPEGQAGLEDLFYEAVSGKCPTQCKLLPLFLTFFFFTVVFTFMAVTPTTVAILRCVPDKQRSFALGVQLVFLRLLGTIPGPILFGVAIDNSCTLWDINDCNTKGACWVYDNERMAYLLMCISDCNKDSCVLCIQVLFAKSSRSSSQSWQYVCISLPQPVQSSHERIQK
ncbi:solute carrier organic anion transporter family member 4C1-like isoform X5 [Lathamus discolor]|uniref:solute carrier organic anion transporter family member 4C1-like isoform X5 n=1 Tax=Lathamus discolor TaxID=678569 RepID=UPI0032B7F8CA